MGFINSLKQFFSFGKKEPKKEVVPSVVVTQPPVAKEESKPVSDRAPKRALPKKAAPKTSAPKKSTKKTN